MSEDRPRPEYGEYATPEQQAAAMGHAYVAPEPVSADPAPALPQAYLARPPGYANRFFTIFLLGVGAFDLFENSPAFFNMVNVLKGIATSAGYSISVPSSANAAGIPILVANVVLYAATVFLSILALRHGRLSFYIPLLGFFAFIVAVWIIVAIYVPGFFSQIAS